MGQYRPAGCLLTAGRPSSWPLRSGGRSEVLGRVPVIGGGSAGVQRRCVRQPAAVASFRRLWQSAWSSHSPVVPSMPAELEEPGVLADLHLAEDRFDDGLAPGVVGPALLGPQPPGHLLPTGGVLRGRSPRCSGHPLAVAEAAGGDEHVDPRTPPCRPSGCPRSSSRHRSRTTPGESSMPASTRLVAVASIISDELGRRRTPGWSGWWPGSPGPPRPPPPGRCRRTGTPSGSSSCATPGR